MMVRRREGFTLIELSFSLVFISILSLTVVVVIANAISAYHKSITLGMVNETGMSIVDDIRASIQASSPNSISGRCEYIYGATTAGDACRKDNGNGFVSVTKRDQVKIDGVDYDNFPVYGAFCTGTYSYIWNSGYFYNGTLDRDKRARLEYKNSSGTIETIEDDFRLLKVKDKERAVCVAALRVENGRVMSTYNVEDINDSESFFMLVGKGLIRENEEIVIDEPPVELLSENNAGGLAIYDLTVAFTEQDGPTKNIFYSSSFILGTLEGGVNIMASTNNCKAPEDYTGDGGKFDYCAINKFNFAAMANGGNE